MESLSPPLVSNRMQSTLNNHTKNMPALSWGASSVSNLQALSSKPSTEEAVGKHPRSRSLSDGNCIWPGGWAKDSCWKSRWIYGKIGSANQGIFIPKYFLGCLWISVEPIRRFRKKKHWSNQLVIREEDLLAKSRQQCYHPIEMAFRLWYNNPFLLILNVPQILKTGVHVQFQKISDWPIWLLIDPL